MYAVNERPERCPYGHELGPGRYSLSYDTTLREHWLLCGGCERRSRYLLDGRHAGWEVRVDGAWVSAEG